jgi:hypothetical protein
MAQYTYTGYDASAHMSEETRQASRAAALGVVMSVVMSVIFGFILLVAVTFAVTDVQGTVNAGAFDVQYIWQHALGTRWAEFTLLIVCVAQFFCGTASVTAASRMMFAFSRDGAVPGGRTFFRKVSRQRVPVNAVIAIALLSWALMLPTLANGAIGYLVGTSIAVIGLYIAYGVPIYLRWRAGDAFEVGAWSLGKHYKWCRGADGHPVAQRLQLERRQLRTDHRRRCIAPRRRVVARVGAQMVQGPGPRRHRGGARAYRGRPGRRRHPGTPAGGSLGRVYSAVGGSPPTPLRRRVGTGAAVRLAP